MDLRSIINNSEAAERSGQTIATPITPVQPGPSPQSFREYSQPPPGALSKHSSQDYGAHRPGSYPSPVGPYQGRPSGPPPLQPPSSNDLRSPAGSSQYSAQSPYRHTPISSISGGQYPFPQSQAPQSPAQTHQYSNTYPQPNAQPPHLQQHGSYSQPSPVPQTPPVGTPGNPQQYLQHHRSQSTHSNSTPTSAHSQQPFQNQHLQDSPLSASPFPQTQIPQHQRQQSQPGTPLGPPLSTQRHSSSNYPQPTSPYQQRPQSSGTLHQQYANSRASPVPSQGGTSIGMPSTPGAYDSQHSSMGDIHRRSQSDRERSVSVSPKTRVPSLPKESSVERGHMENGHTSAQKRKMDDRDVSEPPVTSHIVNGTKAGSVQAAESNNIQPPAKKRVRYNEPPIWAQSSIGRIKPNNALLIAKRQTNGKQPVQAPNGRKQSVPPSVKPPLQVAQPDFKGNGPLGPWEVSITGIKPYEEASRLVADFLFLNVVQRQDLGELASRGVEIEIEAKLGQLINKDTNERFRLPVQSECVLSESARVGFKSSMTEVSLTGTLYLLPLTYLIRHNIKR